jgi:hypothetical protein
MKYKVSIPTEAIFHSYRRENFKSHIVTVMFICKGGQYPATSWNTNEKKRV